MKTKLIFNPVANLGRAHTMLALLRPIASQYSDAQWFHTRSHGHAVDLAASAADEGFERVIALGGDGTTHEVVNGLMQIPADRRPDLGIVSIGSGNDFAHGAGLSGTPEEMLSNALTGSSRTVDISHYHDNTGRSEYWVNSLGIGFDALINIYSRQMKLLKGFWIYLAGAIKAILFNYTSYSIQARMDDRDWNRKILMLVLCNGPREGGGFQIAPSASVDDHRLNYSSVNLITRLQMISALTHYMKGTQDTLNFIQSGEFRNLDLTSDHPLYIHSDGEIFAGLDSKVTRVTVSTVPDEIKLVY